MAVDERTRDENAAEGATAHLFVLDEAHQVFQDVCRAFVTREVLPRVKEAEETETFPHDLWASLGRNGFLGIGYPEDLGGSGAPDALAIAIFSEELARSSGGMAVTPLVSAYMAAPHLARHGTPEQQETYLRPIIAGTKVAAIAVTEPGAGSDVAGITTFARPVTGGYRLRGSKIFITNGGTADVLVVAAKTDPAAGHRGVTMFLVERDDPGFGVGRALVKMGWHASDTRELIFDDCFVPEHRVLGAVGRGFYQIMESFQLERIVLAGMGVGLAQAAFDDALAYAHDRTAFGQALGKFQAIRHRLGEMLTEIQTARLLTYFAATRLDAGDHADEAVAMAKLHTARVANRVADAAVQIFGGYGFIEETRVAMHYRDARILRIGGGTDEIQLEILAKRLGL
ncbi:MAG: acyl-CoA dehydrogenase family protein [Thermomicrobiales bacterium]